MSDSNNKYTDAKSDSVSSTKQNIPEDFLSPLNNVGLLYTPMTKRAMKICFEAHKNQVDKGGMPYVFHPIHVAEQFQTEEEVCAALLHDVAEDSDYTFDDLKKIGICENVLNALRLLTHDPKEKYLSYVSRARKNHIARRVKMADLTHNSDLGRLGSVGKKETRRLLKYRMAQTILQDEKYDTAAGHFRKRFPLSMNKPIFLSVFYNREGTVLKYSFDIEEASRTQYEFTAEYGEKLLTALNPDSTLPEALADWADEKYNSFADVENMLKKANVKYHN